MQCTGIKKTASRKASGRPPRRPNLAASIPLPLPTLDDTLTLWDRLSAEHGALSYSRFVSLVSGGTAPRHWDAVTRQHKLNASTLIASDRLSLVSVTVSPRRPGFLIHYLPTPAGMLPAVAWLCCLIGGQILDTAWTQQTVTVSLSVSSIGSVAKGGGYVPGRLPFQP